MSSTHPVAGVVILCLTVGYFAWRYITREKRGCFPLWGWIGIGVLCAAEFSLAAGVHWVSVYFTPIAWTGYLLAIDGTVMKISGRSRLGNDGRGFLILALLSIPLWLIFEAYNLRLENWMYIGLPSNAVLRDIGYAWSFATIWPAIFETADFARALGFFERPAISRPKFSQTARTLIVIGGALCLATPVLVPQHIGQYLFAPVWAGFVLLLDPLNDLLGGCSLLRAWENGRRSLFWSFVISGLVCGILWEFWNYWAAAKWLYIFPILQGWKIFEMPIPGYIGFPAFALECFVMYETIRVLWAGGLKRQKSQPARVINYEA